MTTLTVRNIPDDLYERLKAAAENNRRSINGEILYRMERSLRAERVPTRELLPRIQRLHATFGDLELTVGQLDRAKRESRP